MMALLTRFKIFYKLVKKLGSTKLRDEIFDVIRLFVYMNSNAIFKVSHSGPFLNVRNFQTYSETNESFPFFRNIRFLKTHNFLKYFIKFNS